MKKDNIRFKKIHRAYNKKGATIYRVTLPKSFVENMFDDFDDDEDLDIVLEYKDTRTKGRRIIIRREDEYSE